MYGLRIVLLYERINENIRKESYFNVLDSHFVL